MIASNPADDVLKQHIDKLKHLGQRPDIKNPALGGFVDWARTQRNQDIKEGEKTFAPYFGAQNPEMAAILEKRKALAFQNGESPEAAAARAAGGAQINRAMQTGLRSLRSGQAVSGVRGGAALGQAMPVLGQAAQARGDLERNIATADMAQRRSDLANYESSLTGERAGLLGSMYGQAGLGAADRSSGLQHSLGGDFLKFAQDNLATAKDAAANIPGANVKTSAPPWWMNGDWYKNPTNMANMAMGPFGAMAGWGRSVMDDNNILPGASGQLKKWGI